MLEDTGMHAGQVLQAIDMMRDELMRIAEEEAFDLTPPKHLTFYERQAENARMFAEIRRKQVK